MVDGPMGEPEQAPEPEQQQAQAAVVLALKKVWVVDGTAPEPQVQAQAQQFRDLGWQSVTVFPPTAETKGTWVIVGEGFAAG